MRISEAKQIIEDGRGSTAGYRVVFDDIVLGKRDTFPHADEPPIDRLDIARGLASAFSAFAPFHYRNIQVVLDGKEDERNDILVFRKYAREP